MLFRETLQAQIDMKRRHFWADVAAGCRTLTVFVAYLFLMATAAVPEAAAAVTAVLQAQGMWNMRTAVRMYGALQTLPPAAVADWACSMKPAPSGRWTLPTGLCTGSQPAPNATQIST